MSNPWSKKLGSLNETPKPSEELVSKPEVRNALATNAAEDQILDQKFTPETISEEDLTRITSGAHKLSRLVSDDFPFDESQLKAVNGMASHQYACLTGAAGTGKTTTTKKLVDTLLNQGDIDNVNMREYFKRGEGDPEDRDDDYEVPDHFIPAICMVGFTGRSAQMIKRNFPRDWHGNIMTIHRMLAFVPEYYDAEDEANPGEWKTKMRFTPTYTADCKLPWDVILIDEAGMVGLDLWHQVWAAAKDGCRIYFVGDINQLPPVHGRSVFGFAMDRFPSYELKHIHRQAGTDNPIVDNAWRILQGKQPISQGRFQMVELKGDAQQSSRMVRGMMPKLQERGVYDPIRDSIITAINGEDGARGYALGQLPLNREFALIFNPKSANPRYIIDGGREKKQFAVGDKVMATKNDHEAGITNGMDGIITDISRNNGYAGEHRRFGLIEDVNAYYAEEGDGEEEDFTLESLHSDFEAMDKGKQEKREKAERGPASHIVTVRFGDGEHAFELPFATLGEVGSLMTSYVKTCHKMQGGESPTVVIICHDSHAQMMYREWLYTAVTRASHMCILLYTPAALAKALSKQSIKGSTLKEKIAYFNALGTNNGVGAAVKVILPAYKWEPEPDEEVIESVPALREPEPKKVAPAAPPPPPTIIQKKFTIHLHTTVVAAPVAPNPEPAVDAEPVDLRSVRVEPAEPVQIEAPRLALMHHAYSWWSERFAPTQLRLTWQAPEVEPDPEPAPEPTKPKNPWAAKLNKSAPKKEEPTSSSDGATHAPEEGPMSLDVLSEFKMDERRFVLAGKAAFNLILEDGTHYTYRVNKKENYTGEPVWFVNLGIKYEEQIYLGMLGGDKERPMFRLTSKSRVSPEKPSVSVFTKWWENARLGKETPGIRMQHAGQCGVCARPLTNPESIERGIGPECWGKVGG